MNKQIEIAIEYYKERKEEILDFINKKDPLPNRKHRLGSDIIISNGKELEQIALKLDALFIAKNN